MQSEIAATEAGVVLEEVPCNFCGSAERVHVLRGTQRTYLTSPDGVWCDAVRCSRCGLVYLSPRVEEASIGRFYPASEYYAYRDPADGAGRLSRLKQDVFFAVARRYFGYPAGSAGRSNSALVSVLAALSFMLMRARFSRIPPYVPGGRLLEFGFGAGGFLSRMRELGWECWGVELNAGARERVGAQGIRVFASIDDPAIPEEHFDCVTSFHAVEHTFDPKSVFRRMHAMLRPGGHIFCGVPNFDSVLGRMFRTYWDNLGVPIHPYVFTARSLRMFLQSCGFGDIRIRYHAHPLVLTGSVQWAWNDAIWRMRGRKYVSTSIRSSRILQAIAAPAVKLLDWFGLGDSVEATARKS